MNAIFTGRRRSGKTTLAFYMALESGGGVIVFDPKREFRSWPATVSDVSQLEKAAKEKNTVIIYHPNGDTEEEFRPVAEWIISQHDLAMSRGWDSKGFHFTLICDEAHNLQGPNWANPQLLQILSQNRPEILNVFQTFQSPKDAYNRIKSRVSDWFIFSTNLPSDLEYLQREIGVNEEDTKRITTLGDHEYVHVHFDGGQPVAEFVTDSSYWFVDLNYTKEQEKEMSERNDDDKRDKKLQYPGILQFLVSLVIIVSFGHFFLLFFRVIQIHKPVTRIRYKFCNRLSTVKMEMHVFMVTKSCDALGIFFINSNFPLQVFQIGRKICRKNKPIRNAALDTIVRILRRLKSLKYIQNLRSVLAEDLQELRVSPIRSLQVVSFVADKRKMKPLAVPSSRHCQIVLRNNPFGNRTEFFLSVTIGMINNDGIFFFSRFFELRHIRNCSWPATEF